MDKYQTLPIVDLHPCIQGEGRLTGVPHLLVRTSRCNLRCQFHNSICDTPFASWEPERGGFSIMDIEEMICRNNLSHIMLTGGEPTMHPQIINEMIRISYDYDMDLTIETNGTNKIHIPEGREIYLISVSPKLMNSIPSKLGRNWRDKHDLLRINYEVLKDFISRDEFNFIQFKFVLSELDITTGSPSVREMIKLIYDLKIPPHNVWLMPEGDIQYKLIMNRKAVYEYALENRFNYSDRLQILVYDNERGR